MLLPCSATADTCTPLKEGLCRPDASWTLKRLVSIVVGLIVDLDFAVVVDLDLVDLHTI
ncbi:MAG: hypothetical protein WCD63_03715 [Terrimicrobiaceae bacterium]